MLSSPDVLRLGSSTTGVLVFLWSPIELANGVTRGAATAEPVGNGDVPDSAAGV